MNAASQIRSRINSGVYNDCNVGDFKKDLLMAFDLHNHVKADKTYALAWSLSRQIYPGDLHSVLTTFELLTTLVKD